MRIGVVALARPTFDVDSAGTVAGAAVALAEHTAGPVSGTSKPAMDLDAVAEASAALGDIDLLVILQATFTDGTLHRAAADRHPDVPIVLWAFPEARTGNRLLLNSLCGINLGGFTLADRDLRWLYASPEDESTRSLLQTALDHPTPRPARSPFPAADGDVDRVMKRLGAYKIGAVGDHPEGFDPCDFTTAELTTAGGATVDRVELADLFAGARVSENDRVSELKRSVGDRLAGLADLDDDGVTASLRLHLGLQKLGSERAWDAVATRCWPECFTEMGGAACAAQAMLADAGIPAVCERDVFGALTALLLRDSAGSSPFVADLVDIDIDDDTAAIWHCGIAPLSIAHPDDVPTATIHPNRGLPLLHQFRIRPGRITIARISRSRHRVRMAVGGGEILDRPRPCSGTSAVFAPDGGAAALVDPVMSERLEHHYGIVHGDVRGTLVAVAERLGIEVVAT